jgi:hypothetical protein
MGSEGTKTIQDTSPAVLLKKLGRHIHNYNPMLILL